MLKNLTNDQKVITLCLLLVTLFINPFTSFDPLNIPRLFTLSIFGLSSFFLLTFKFRYYFRKFRFLTIFVSLFVGWISVVSVFSEMSVLEAFFGVDGRNTGFLTYFSLAFIFLLTAVSMSENLLSSIFKAGVITGLIAQFYGLIQGLALDPFNWTNPYSPVFSFFGNPNFHSSFMALSANFAVATLFSSQVKFSSKIFSIAYVIVALVNIYLSESKQGYLIFFAGTSIIVLFWLRIKFQRRAIFKFYLSSLFSIAILAILDIFRKAPWPSILYEDSVSIRGDLWRAGWKMTLENPLFGVGLDGYRDNYRLSRDSVAAQRETAYATSDSAHNVFIDIASGGGFPLLVLYLIMFFLVIKSALRILKNSKNYNFVFVGIFSAWVSYVLQSIVSINQIGLAIWGWILSGAIIGFDMLGKNELRDSRNFSSNKIELISITLGILLGLSLTLPLLNADIQFREAVKSGNIDRISEIAGKYPQSVVRMNLIVRLYRDSGYYDNAIDIAKMATKFNSDNFDAWYEYYLIPGVPEYVKKDLKEKVKELDPLNPNIN